jgi:hypothetical protein
MRTETDPVSDDEFVYRRVLKDYYNEFPSCPRDRINRLAFRPTDRDTEGLSVYRALFVHPKELDVDSEGRPGRYYIARLAVGAVREMALSITPDPAEGPQGHSLIPEIRTRLKGRDKSLSKEKQVALARLASEDIVYTPPN